MIVRVSLGVILIITYSIISSGNSSNISRVLFSYGAFQASSTAKSLGKVFVEGGLVWFLSTVDSSSARGTDAAWGRWRAILDFIWGYDAVRYIFLHTYIFLQFLIRSILAEKFEANVYGDRDDAVSDVRL